MGSASQRSATEGTRLTDCAMPDREGPVKLRLNRAIPSGPRRRARPRARPYVRYNGARSWRHAARGSQLLGHESLEMTSMRRGDGERTSRLGTRPPGCAFAPGRPRDQGGHETGQHVGQRELPGHVRLLDGWGAWLDSDMQGGSVDELLDVAVECPALDQLEVEVGRTLEDRVHPGLTGDHWEERHGRGRPGWRPSAPGSSTGCRASAMAPRTPP
jgi:hypothetical protein